jgi:hypothetical protein
MLLEIKSFYLPEQQEQEQKQKSGYKSQSGPPFRKIELDLSAVSINWILILQRLHLLIGGPSNSSNSIKTSVLT